MYVRDQLDKAVHTDDGSNMTWLVDYTENKKNVGQCCMLHAKPGPKREREERIEGIPTLLSSPSLLEPG